MIFYNIKCDPKGVMVFYVQTYIPSLKSKQAVENKSDHKITTDL